MKYLILANKVSESVAQVFKEYPMRSGFFNWAKVMEADMLPYNHIKDDLEKYDVVHINLAPVDWWLAFDVRKRLQNSSTKLVVNNDHVSEHWHRWNLDPNLYLQVQDCGDLVFGTEPYQVSQMIDKAICMPHPTNIKEIKIFKNRVKQKKNDVIGMFYHFYDETNLQKVLLTKSLKQDLKCKMFLYNYVKEKNKESSISEYWFDKIFQQFEFPQFCMSLMRNKMMIELAEYHTYGRATVETAALGIPTVGSDRVFSMKHNFPKLVCDPLDHRKIRELAKKVWNNSKFRQEQIDYAYNACEYFNYANCKKRMMKALDEVKK